MEGTEFGHYQLLSLLGRGGMGEVWRAYDRSTERVVALKVLPVNQAGDDAFEKRFRREAQAVASLLEPHVIPIHGFGEIDGRLYVDMRLILGDDLQQVLADGPLDPIRAVAIIEQIALALNAAHDAGLTHRDVKPSNILLTASDYAYLIDFGIARMVDETSLTSRGSIIGTWAYMAPERFGTGEVGPLSDVYGLACVLYEALTGQRPFPGESMERQVLGHLSSPPPQPSAVHDLLPVALDEVIARGMAKDPDDRYPTTIALANAARAALTNPAAIATVPPLDPTELAPCPADFPLGAAPTPSTSRSAVDAAASTQRRPPISVATHPAAPPVAAPVAPAVAASRPRRRGRRLAVIAAALALVALVALTVRITFGSSRTSPDTTAQIPTSSAAPPPQTLVDRVQVAKEISNQLAEQVGRAPDDVSCPDDLKATLGATLRCNLTDQALTYGVTVTVTRVRGIDVDFSIKVDDQPLE